MPSASWPRVKVLFEEAQQRPAAERAAWLGVACGGDEALRAEVERLLAADDEAEEYFDTLARDLGAEAGLALPLPEQIGPWRIVREVGRGGMGQVLLGERDDGLFAQRVAIKLVHPGLAPDLAARFRAERRILARLDHAGIARLLDGGRLEDGRPYLVMDYVEGEALTAFADRKRLSIDARLDLFAQVCDAVAYAHRHLVVHRDLKPSNVLVSAGETEAPQVTLLDFGIAKLLSREDTTETAMTRTEGRLLTPHYAAPEQVQGGAVTTATDVYALGVLLYELLTGHRPYGPTQRSAHTVEQAILKDEPTVPSIVVARGKESETLAAVRATEPARLRRRLHGDLDRIVLKALRKEPVRRYATAEAFMRDVERHRAGHPIEARPPTLGYRASRFVRRHRTGVVLTAAVVVLSVAFALVYTHSVTTERDRTATERDRAERVSTFLTDLLTAADDPTADRTALLRLLEPAVARAEQELAADPEAQAAVLHALGNLYARAGRFDRADSLLRRTLDARRALHVAPHEDLAATLYDLGYLETEMGPRDSALVHFRAAAEMRRALHNEDHPAYAQSLLQWARMLPTEHPDKRPRFEEAMALLRQLHGARSPEIAAALHEYYVLGYGGGTAAQVESAFREALAIYEENGMERHPYALHAMANLATTLDRPGSRDEALGFYRRSAELSREVLPPGDGDRISMIVNYGATLHEQGQLDEADQVLSEIVATTRRLLPDSAGGIAQSHYWYGRNLIALGQMAEAEPLLRTAEASYALNNNELRRLRTQAERAVALAWLGQRAAAERLLKEAVQGLQGTVFERRALGHLIAFYEDAARSGEASPYRARITALGE